jgi:hypothetical protein
MSAMRTRLPVSGCLLLLAAVCLTSIARAQPSWSRTYGGTSDDEANSVKQTSDGGYIMVGYTQSFGAGNPDAYLVKTDASGDTLWTRTYGGSNTDGGFSVQQTADSGYIIAGWTTSFGTGSSDVWLIKTDVQGDTLWTSTYGGAGTEWGYSVQQTTDGGYIVGSCYLDGMGHDVWLIKTDAQGDTLWASLYRGTNVGGRGGNFVQQTVDGGYMIAGYDYGTGAGDIFLTKTNAAGDTLWARTYGGTNDDWANSAQQTTDGGYVVAGYTRSFGAGDADVYLVKTNALGDTLWTRTYGGPGFDAGYSARQTRDGGYVVAGTTTSFGAGAADVYLVKTNAFGDTLWTGNYGGARDDVGYSVAQTADGGFAIAGYTTSFGVGSPTRANVYLIKTDSLGNVGVVEESPKPQVMRGRLGTTVLSGASGVRHLASSVAYDAMGRRVLHPKLGIYFVRPTATAPPRKVLLVE